MVSYLEDKEQLLTRLRRIEGQVRGLQRMIEEDQYCVDVLTQISSVSGALRAVALELLDDHARHCVRDGIQNGNADEKVDELLAAVGRLTAR